jgi:tetratricopeptide (TPR) repeat protein
MRHYARPWRGGGAEPLQKVFAGALLLATLLLVGCPLEELLPRVKDDLTLAEEALSERDIGDAEMYFERYLRKNPDGEDRWEVWLQLLSISLDIRQDKATAGDYLEIMLSEFNADPPKRRHIQMALAGLYKDMRLYFRAFLLWEALATDPGLSSEERALVYRELSHAYLRRLEFTSATDILGLCLQLDVRPDTKADCLYALAETQMLTDKLGESEQALRDLLLLTDISTDRRVLATFILADVLEQRDKLQEAASLFESIRETYPNTKVVTVRLSALKDKMGAKKSGKKK